MHIYDYHLAPALIFPAQLFSTYGLVCVAEDYKKANHNPIAVLNGNHSRSVFEITAKPGETVALSAEVIHEADKDAFELAT